MIDKLSSWILSRFSLIPTVDTEELSALELIGKTATKTNEVVDEVNNQGVRLTTVEAEKLDITELEQNRKLDANGNFTGTWQGHEFSDTDQGMSDRLNAHIIDFEGLKNTKMVRQKENEVHTNLNELVSSIIQAAPTTVYTSLTHAGFPGIVNIGTKMLISFREGDTHTTLDGVIKMTETTDGLTFTNTRTIITEAGFDCRDPQLFKTNQGTILLKYFVRTTTTTSKVKVSRSIDGGETWETPVQFPVLPTIPNGSSRGDMVQLTNGRILATVYCNNIASVFYSDNDGDSWDYLSTINDPSEVIINETALCTQDNLIYAVSRCAYKDGNGSDVYNHLYMFTSEDNGLTWSEPITLPLFGHAPSLYPLSDGRMVLTYRATNEKVNPNGDLGDVALVILNHGEIDSDIIVLYSDKTSRDNGYTQECIYNNTLYVVFYDGTDKKIYLQSALIDDLLNIKKFYEVEEHINKQVTTGVHGLTYKEGSWTPALTGNTADGVTHSIQYGKYIKINNQVFIHGKLTITSKGTIAGGISIKGLPFPAMNSTHGGLLIGMVSGLTNSAGYTQFGGYFPANTDKITLQEFGSNMGSKGIVETQLAATFTMTFSATYQTV